VTRNTKPLIEGESSLRKGLLTKMLSFTFIMIFLLKWKLFTVYVKLRNII